MTPEYVARYRALAAEVIATAHRQMRPDLFAAWLAGDMGRFWSAWLPELSVEAVRDQMRRAHARPRRDSSLTE